MTGSFVCTVTAEQLRSSGRINARITILRERQPDESSSLGILDLSLRLGSQSRVVAAKIIDDSSGLKFNFSLPSSLSLKRQRPLRDYPQRPLVWYDSDVLGWLRHYLYTRLLNFFQLSFPRSQDF